MSYYSGTEILDVRQISYGKQLIARAENSNYVVALKIDSLDSLEKEKIEEYLTSGCVMTGHGGPGMPDSYSIFRPLLWVAKA